MSSAFFENWTTQVRKGMLELAILNAVSRTRIYGYEIAKRLSRIDGLVVTEGTIYPILSRLKREGLMATSLAESREGPARKYYQLTPLGRKLLGQMNAYWSVMKSGVDHLEGST